MEKRLLLLSLLLLLVACNGDRPVGKNNPNTTEDNVPGDYQITAEEKQETPPLEMATLQYAKNIDQVFMDANRGNPENFSYSPLGIALPTLVTIDFSTGTDRGEIIKKFDLQDTDFSGQSQALAEEVADNDTLVVNNSWWLNQDSSIDGESLKKYASKVRSPIYLLPFNREATEQYSKWQKDVFGKIMNEKEFDPDSSLLLANALQFKGKWIDPFYKEANYRSDFTNQDGSIVEREFMSQQGTIPIVETDDYLAVEKDMDEDFTAYFILPKENKMDTVREQIAEITESLPDRVEFTDVIIDIPKVEISTSTLYDKDSNLGSFQRLYDLYTTDLSQYRIYLTSIGQFIDLTIDEEGASADILTEVDVVEESALADEPKQIRFNQPFIFTVQDANRVTVVTSVIQNLSE